MDQADSSSGQLQVKAACAKELIDAERPGCIPVMVSIKKAPLSAMTAERPPIDLVLVLHIRKGCPAPVEWRRLLMEAVVVTLGKLGHTQNDRLAVLADSRARGVRKPEEEMDKELTQSMYAKYWKEVPLMQVSDENCRQVQVSAVNKAIRSETLVVTALELAISMLHNREYGDKENRTAYVIVISNSDEQDIGSLLAWRSLSVHAFGFRDAHNARTMCGIASGSPECTYALLDDERGGMTKAFAACIDRITSAGVANMPIEVKLKCERKVVLEAIDAPRISYFISSEKDVGTIWTSTQQACACVPTKFIIYLKPREGEEKLNNMDLLKFFTVRVKYGHITTANAPDGNCKLLDGKVVCGNYVVTKVKTMEHRGEVVLVRKGVEIYKEMAAEMVRIKAVKIVADITREEDPNQLIHLVNLAEKLHERWTALLNNSGCGQEAGDLISMLALQMQEMQLRLHNNYFWLEYMLSWQSHQLWQLPLPPLFMDKRATQVDDPPLQLAIFPKDRATPWGNEYTVPRQLKVAVRVTAPGLKRCPVDLIAVLDASCACAAGGEKAQKRLRLLVEATELVMTKLHDHMDRLAIMHVNQPDAASLTSLMDMSEESRNKISAMLKSSLVVVSKPPPAMANENATQTSHWREQLHNKAMKLVRKLLSSASANTALTPPERQSTAAVAQSVGGSSNLWKALEGAKQILVNRLQAEKEQRAGFIIVISDSNDDSIIHEAPRRPETDFDYIVHAVSFHDGGPRNTRAMNHIAHCSNGIYAVLDDGQYQITNAFTSCINKITSIVVVSTVVTIRCNHDSVVLNSIQSSGQVLRTTDHERKSVSIPAGTFYAGTVRNFIAILDNVGWYEYGMFHKFFKVDVTWRHPLSKKESSLSGEVYVRDASEVFKEVESHLIVANTVTVITDPNLDRKLVADREAKEKDKQVIEQQLMDELRRLFHECSREARDAGEALLAKEMEKLKDNLETERVKMHANQTAGKGLDRTFIEKLLAEPLSYMLSWLSRDF